VKEEYSSAQPVDLLLLTVGSMFTKKMKLTSNEGNNIKV